MLIIIVKYFLQYNEDIFLLIYECTALSLFRNQKTICQTALQQMKNNTNAINTYKPPSTHSKTPLKSL